MTPANAYRRAIIALKAKIQKSAGVANLYPAGVRTPEVANAWRERGLDLSAIEMFQNMIRPAPRPDANPGE